jgi:drug/metabolite transporter (DMT)-like permease
MIERTALDNLHRLKAFTSVAVLGMSVVMGLETPNRRTLIIVLCISAGVALASLGEIHLCAPAKHLRRWFKS